MADFLRNWIINITVIIIFVMFLDTIMPNSSMKRYINVIVGLLIIIVVIRPFVLVKDYAESFNTEFAETASFMEQDGIEHKSTEISKFQRLKAIEIFESNLKSRILKVVRNIVQVNEKDVAISLELERNFEVEEFGDIKSVTVSINNGNSEIIQVDRIKIDSNGSAEQNKNVIKEDKDEYNLNDSKISREIRDGISEALGISESIVSVKVRQ